MLKFCLFLISLSTYLLSTEYQVAFYSDFEPVSYAVNRDPSHPQFNEARGYEVDLLKAISLIPESNMTFRFHGIKEWNNLWLAPSTQPHIDIAMGGITREERRLLNDKGEKVVDSSHSTLHFKQSLLMTSKDAVQQHTDLNCSYTVGAVIGTTGEYRFLAQANLIDSIDKGLIRKGITVITQDRQRYTSDGSLSIYDERLTKRLKLIPHDCSLPVVHYFEAEDSMIPALKEGWIDAIARGYIGNKLVADRSNGELAVTAIYSLECPKQESITCEKKEEGSLFVKAGNQTLLNKLNRYIDYLTDNGKIQYEDWEKNPSIFEERAKKFQ